MSARHVAMPREFADAAVTVIGSGRPVVYLHGLGGPGEPEFLELLGRESQVFAPTHPGTIEPADLGRLPDLWNLVLWYDDLFEALGLGSFDLVGHSFGGMVAAEIAATLRPRLERLVLIDPLGLWRDDLPVADHLLVSPETRRALLRGDAAEPVLSEDRDAAQTAFLDEFAALAASAHFIHPIPERGLVSRLPRVRAQSLVLWGADDRLVPAEYAKEFGRLLPDVEVEVLGDAGHTPHLDRPGDVAARIHEFLRRDVTGPEGARG